MHCRVVKSWRLNLWVHLLAVIQFAWTGFFAVCFFINPRQIEMVMAGLWFALLLLPHRKHRHYHTSYHLVFSLLGLPYIPRATDLMLLTSFSSVSWVPFKRGAMDPLWLTQTQIHTRGTQKLWATWQPARGCNHVINPSLQFCSGSVRMPSSSSAVLPHLPHHSHSLVGLTHLWEVPVVTLQPRGSAVILIYI